MAVFKKILFEVNPEGLIEIIVKICDEHIGKIMKINPVEMSEMESMLVSVDTLEVGEQIGIADIKRNCTGLIKYPVAKVVELDKLQYHLSDFEQSALKSSFPISFDEFTYIEDTAFIERAEGIVKDGEKSLFVWWDDTGGAFIGDLRIPEFDLILS